MSIRSLSLRFILNAVCAVTIGIVAVALLPAQSAQAIGNNREVFRSCGSNYVSSGWYTYNTYAWAQTTKSGGSCSGRLSAGLRANDGYVWPRVYGTTNSAYTSRTDTAGFGSGDRKSVV